MKRGSQFCISGPTALNGHAFSAHVGPQALPGPSELPSRPQLLAAPTHVHPGPAPYGNDLAMGSCREAARPRPAD